MKWIICKIKGHVFDGKTYIVPLSEWMTLTTNKIQEMHVAGDVRLNRCERCDRYFAKENNAILVLKGSPTIVATPDGRCFINGSGNPLLASGGTGDVLAGLIGGLLCQGCAPDVAAVLAVFLHGFTADRLADEAGDSGILASELLLEIPLTRHLLINRSEELC